LQKDGGSLLHVRGRIPAAAGRENTTSRSCHPQPKIGGLTCREVVPRERLCAVDGLEMQIAGGAVQAVQMVQTVQTAPAKRTG